MSGFFTMIAENILVIIGFALYGVLVYYMVAKAIRRYTGGKPRRGSKKSPGRNKSISEQDSTEANVFFTMFRNPPEKSEEEDLSDDPKSHYELISCERWGEWAPTGISWEYRLAEESMISACGNYLFYARPCEMKEGVDWAEEGEERYQPCCYNTVTGEETVLMRSCGLNCSVYAVNVTSDYLLVSYTDDPAGDGESLKIEKLSDPAVVFDVGELVRGAETADAFIQQEAERKAAEEEALKNEPYGPGTSTLYLSAPDDKSACYRLVRMDGSTEFMVLLSPGEETSRSFPCGRYALKTAEGDTWISDEEAFGDAGHYSTTDIFTFEAGGAYEISSGTRGDFYSDDAGGFTGQ